MKTTEGNNMDDIFELTALPPFAALDGSAAGPSGEDVGWWWLKKDYAAWQVVLVAYTTYIEAGDEHRYQITPGMKWGGKVRPPNDRTEPQAKL